MQRFLFALIGIVLLVTCSRGGSVGSERPETVMVTFHAKPGAEAELAQVIARHWRTGRELQLVLPAPHLTLRGADAAGNTYFVDVFAWRDPSVPDAAPAEIRKIWAEMSALVVDVGQRPGLTFDVVSVVAP